ncbi:GNAT family N-acetyltransferase [Kurthia sp. Dielmo]|uniref:GNAT family N-acetyltransferase n=1 Tax=Kurthia sp. Dielmo TaxID=1033738 RepID=UPI00111F34BF|nr:GNAT family N-acetyltransferase [Kurthia sp. Dielmo]
MEFELTEKGYELFQQGKSVARIEWYVEDNVMQMTGTHTDEVLRGQGIAGKLLNEAVEYARAHDYKMKAICPYVVKKFEDSAFYNDVKI